jgi:hypothetical protein
LDISIITNDVEYLLYFTLPKSNLEISATKQFPLYFCTREVLKR